MSIGCIGAVPWGDRLFEALVCCSVGVGAGDAGGSAGAGRVAVLSLVL